eukprot:3911278-Prorocentrum_lima.AAC.1
MGYARSHTHGSPATSSRHGPHPLHHRGAYMTMAKKIPGIMEHPERARWEPRAPSIWDQREITEVCEMGAQTLHLDQWVFGAPSRKPT